MPFDVSCGLFRRDADYYFATGRQFPVAQLSQLCSSGLLVIAGGSPDGRAYLAFAFSCAGLDYFTSGQGRKQIGSHAPTHSSLC